MHQESKHMKMGSTLTSIILVILFCGSAIGDRTRTKLLSVKGQDGMSAAAPVPSDGVCKSMVETRGYVCEEHSVEYQHSLVSSRPSIEFYCKH